MTSLQREEIGLEVGWRMVKIVEEDGPWRRIGSALAWGARGRRGGTGRSDKGVVCVEF